MKKVLNGCSHIEEDALITLKTFVSLTSSIEELFDFSNNDKKREIVKLLFSKTILVEKNVMFSIRKPIDSKLSMGNFHNWLLIPMEDRTQFDIDLTIMTGCIDWLNISGNAAGVKG
ncbi:MAG: hypothetical protein LBU87_06425 [Lactobacillales bacterium]|jgi:hypothetical protein|nr:hypothetical protein [Lactobacillales bacterium]